jgi:hypothetical protein
MVQVRYLGVANPKAAFDALRPLRKQLIDLQMKCRPFGPDYLILDAAKTALDTAAYHFTREPDFFSARLDKPGTSGDA